MNEIGIIGLGNCGGQIAFTAESKYPELFKCMYMNTSKDDLNKIGGNSLKFKIGDSDNEADDIVEGTGRNRKLMRNYLKKYLGPILGNDDFTSFFMGKNYVFIIASAAGGTGSGSCTPLMEILQEYFPNIHFILVTTLPPLTSSSREQKNAMALLKDIYTKMSTEITYMVYDNGSITGRSPNETFGEINDQIIEDLRILTGIDNHKSKFDSIDETDLKVILTTPGRLLISRLSEVTEKKMEDSTLDESILKAIKKSCHTETNRDRKVLRWGIITHLTKEADSLYVNEFPKLEGFLGTPIERFNHHAINNMDDEKLNFVHFIASGLSPINDRSDKIATRIHELTEAAKSNKAASFKYADDSDDRVDTDDDQLPKSLDGSPTASNDKFNPSEILKKFM